MATRTCRNINDINLYYIYNAKKTYKKKKKACSGTNPPRRRRARPRTPPPPPAGPTSPLPAEFRGTQAANNNNKNNKNSNNGNWVKVEKEPTYDEYGAAIRAGVEAPAKNTGLGRNAENSTRKGALAGRRSSATGPIVMAPKKKAWWKRGKYNPLNYFGGRNTRRKRRRRRRKTQRKTRRRRTKRRRRRRR